jgi:hypothetical protein
MAYVIDYSFWHPATFTDLTTTGVIGVCRYLAPLPNPKVITKPEYDALHAGGLGVALVWEETTHNWQGGYPRGFTDGGIARAQAKSLGHTRPVFVAYDTSINPQGIAIASEYQRGFNTAYGQVCGVYGTSWVIDQLVAAGLAVTGWRTNATGWYGNSADTANASLRQHYGSNLVPGLAGGYDTNDILKIDWLQSPAPVVQGPAHPPTTVKGNLVDRFEVIVPTDAQGNGWAQTAVPWDKYRGAEVQGSAPTRDGGYWPGDAHGNNTNNQALITVTGATPSANIRVFVFADH